MGLSVADIERWSAGDVREVFHAAHSRAQAARDAADGLAGLPALSTWGGVAADAAREAIGRTRRDLDSQGNEALTVAAAARTAADHIEAIQSSLRQLKADAAGAGLEADAPANRIVPIPGSHHSRRQMQHAIPPLQTRLNAIVEQANSVDAELAAAIHLADGTAPLEPSLHAGDPQAQQALAGLLPGDPRQFHDLWQSLSKEDRDLLYSRDNGIGNHPGMRVGDDGTFDADHYNRRHLADALARAEEGQRMIAEIGAEHPDWALGLKNGRPGDPGYLAWRGRMDAAVRQTHGLEDLRAVKATLDKNPGTRLMMLDTASGERVHAALAVGDPDNADHVSVTTPGLNTTVAGAVDAMTREARTLQKQALLRLATMPGHESDTVAAIGWIGYDAPQIPGVGDPGTSLAGAWGVSHDGIAKDAAVDLSRFYDGIQAAHAGGPTHLTAVGHSYGSLTTGLALQQPGNHGVSDAVFYGSPGIEATTPGQLQLQAGHVFVMETPDDPIQWVYDGPPLVKALAPPGGGVLVDGAQLTGAGDFGPNPATNPNFVQMQTGAVTLPDGQQLQGAAGHSDYPRMAKGPNDSELLRTTVYNIAAVVAGAEPVRK